MVRVVVRDGRASRDPVEPVVERPEPEDAYIKQSIVDPNAVVVSGFQSGVMPTTFGKTLSPEELDALVAFLSGKEAK